MSHTTASSTPQIAFIGGGNMASAIIGGLISSGLSAEQIQVVEPFEAARTQLKIQFGINALASGSDALHQADLVVWAVKPQSFKEAATSNAAFVAKALHLSVAAGIRSSSIAAWLGTERIVRAMPNTPALVARGMTGLFARSAVSASDKTLTERVIQPTGEFLWLDDESKLDAVTALSGSGPAYVFYFLEAMQQAGMALGLSAAQSIQLATATFAGATALAQSSTEPPELLRDRVTSKGGTTYAALTHMEQASIKSHFMDAIRAAHERAQSLGDEFGL